jgi:hypothetical protein
MSALPSELAPLAHLDQARGDAGRYYAALFEHADVLVQVGAWCAALERDAIVPALYARLVELSGRYGAVRSRAFRFLEKQFEHGLARDVAVAGSRHTANAETEAMLAELADDADAAESAARDRYFASGRFDLLLDLSDAAERVGGWRAALDVAVSMVVLFPHEPVGANRLLRILHMARRAELLDAAIRIFDRNGLHPYLALLYRAAWHLLQGNARECLAALGRLGTARATRADVLDRVRSLAGTLSAEAYEMLGDYQRAFALYGERNRPRSDRDRFGLDELPRLTLDAAARSVPELPPDPHGSYFVMTGFPRSGTTLLENALAAHPLIETFEEIPSRESVEKFLRRPGVEGTSGQSLYLTARERYYDEIERRRHKTTARIFLDKMPMRSIEAGFMSKLFPDKRYIFSIRHPYDVVLSCFKQDFGRNIAMEHFRTLDDAARLYDFTMTQWFGVFGLGDPRVHYLRYEDLVTSFEPSMRGVLSFLGVDWDADVVDFADAAERRAARTPSYQKVRQGLSIGVQSSWQHYRFAFQSEAATALKKWVEMFGYDPD